MREMSWEGIWLDEYLESLTNEELESLIEEIREELRRGRGERDVC